MKVMSADVVHKYDAGGVLLNIHGADEARAAYDKILGNVRAGRARRQDPGHPRRGDGPQGRGSDSGRQPRSAFRTADDVRSGRHAGRGAQGRVVPPGADVADLGREHGPRRSAPSRCSTASAATRPRDIDAIVDTLLRLSTMVCNHPEISELDINPLIVHAQGPRLLGGRQPHDAPLRGAKMLNAEGKNVPLSTTTLWCPERAGVRGTAKQRHHA